MMHQPGQIVSQAYCFALPVGYSNSPTARNWEPFARLILDATYEATLAAAVINAKQHGTNKVLLTKIGGGVFSNDLRWIYKSYGAGVYKNMKRPDWM